MPAPALLAGLLGAAVGSFLTVVAHRVPRGQSVVSPPRSRCPACGASVRAWDNVPILSWLALRARCRDCGGRIPARYPLVELVTAVLFLAVVAVHGLSPRAWLGLAFVALLVAVALIDLEHRIIPNRLLWPAAIAALVLVTLWDLGRLPEHLLAGAGAFTFLLVAALAYPGGMGMGDVKLAGVMGLFLGSAMVPAMALAFLAGSVVGVAIILRHGAAARKRGVPFGPFLAIGGVAGVLAGEPLIDLYVQTLLS